MAQKEVEKKEVKRGFLTKFINGIEIAGNKLPHPFWLFLSLWGLVLIATLIFSGTNAINPATGEEVIVRNLLNRQGIDWILRNVVSNYSGFAPLGLVLVMMIGLGVTTKSGFMDTTMKKIGTANEKYLIFFVFLFGMLGNLASSAASVIIPPLAASLFYSMRKNPIFGLALGYVAVSSGFTANLFITGTDVLAAGLSTSAFQIVDPDGVVYPTANYFFMAASVVIIAGIGAWFTSKVLMPRFGQWEEKFEHCEAAEDLVQGSKAFEISESNNKGFKSAILFTIVYWGVLFALYLPPGGPLRDPVEGTLIPSTFISGIMPLLLLYFILVGVVYGKRAGTINNASDVVAGMQSGARSMTGLVVIILPISNFVAAFRYSNMATVLSIRLANLLTEHSITGMWLILGVIGINCIVNIFITSGTTQWALLAPVVVPLMYYMGYTPAFAQLLYRIGDSATNTITPLHSYIALHLAVAKRYDKDAGLGSIISRTFPLAMLFLGIWLIMLFVWITFDLPLGPGDFIRL